MNLYIVRHDQTDWNVAGKCQIIHDDRLVERGFGQLEGKIEKNFIKPTDYNS